jgi:hypothetical protein
MSVLQLKSAKLSDLKFTVIPRNFAPGFTQTDLFNRTFEFWRSFWIDVFDSNQANSIGALTDFFFADALGVLTYQNEIVGVHIYTFFNSDQSSTRIHPYFSQYEGEAFLKFLDEQGYRSSLALGYLAINPEWRKSQVGLSIGSMLIALGAELQKDLQIDASLGRCRTDVKTNRMLTSLGGTTIKEAYMMHNTPCDFVVMERVKLVEHPDELSRQYVREWWNQRLNLLEFKFKNVNQKTA